VTGAAAWPKPIEKKLRELNAPAACYLVDEAAEPVNAPLGDALTSIVGITAGACFVSCTPGRLGYFESEAGRWILFRPAAPRAK
jgi:hypothetical protein